MKSKKARMKTIKDTKTMETAYQQTEGTSPITERGWAITKGVPGACFFRVRPKVGTITIWGHTADYTNWQKRIDAAAKVGKELPEARYRIDGLNRWVANNPHAKYFVVIGAPCGRLVICNNDALRLGRPVFVTANSKRTSTSRKDAIALAKTNFCGCDSCKVD